LGKTRSPEARDEFAPQRGDRRARDLETSDGALYMAERFVKFAGGQAACSAPPSGSPEMIAANMGKMTFEQARKPGAVTEITPQARLRVSHPNHTGMVLDQLTLLYVPLHIVTGMEVLQGTERVFALKGSITLSQDPVVDFDYRVNGAGTMHVLVRDSEGASWERSFPIGEGS
jgi:sulfur-oxidizing protein SoxY